MSLGTAVHLAVIGIIALIVVLMIPVILIDDRRRRRNYEKYGWYVNVSGGAEDVSIHYIERAHGLALYGPRPGTVILVPTADSWDSMMPDFARGRRDVILQRLKQECKQYKFVERDGAIIGEVVFRRDWDPAKR